MKKHHLQKNTHNSKLWVTWQDLLRHCWQFLNFFTEPLKKNYCGFMVNFIRIFLRTFCVGHTHDSMHNPPILTMVVHCTIKVGKLMNRLGELDGKSGKFYKTSTIAMGKKGRRETFAKEWEKKSIWQRCGNDTIFLMIFFYFFFPPSHLWRQSMKVERNATAEIHLNHFFSSNLRERLSFSASNLIETSQSINLPLLTMVVHTKEYVNL